MPPPAPRRRRRSRTLLIVALLAGALGALILAAPMLLSIGPVRARVERELGRALGADVALASYRLSWFSGFEVEGLRVGNPPGFDPERPAIELSRAHGDVSLWSLLRGRADVEATVEGLEVLVLQRANGESNLRELLGVDVGVEIESPDRPAPRDPDRDPGALLGDLRLDLDVIDARIDIEHEERGVLESLRNLDVSVQKEFDRPDVTAKLTADLHRPGAVGPGTLGIDVDYDASGARPIVADLRIVGLDLARYQPLLASFVPPADVEAFQGLVGGSVQSRIDLRQRQYAVEGHLNIDSPHFAGRLFHGLDLRGDHWVLSPKVSVAQHEDGRPPTVDAEGLRVHLGFLKVDGLPAVLAAELAQAPSALGVAFEIDIAALAALGGPIPPWLRGASGIAHGRIALPVGAEGFDAQALASRALAQVAAEIDVRVNGLAVAGHAVEGAHGGVRMARGKAIVEAAATVAGGPAELRVDFDAAQGAWPGSLGFSWQDGRAQAGAVPALRYAVPLLAGLEQTGGGFESTVACTLRCAGPLLPSSFASTLAWLDQWSGKGSLSLSEGSFTPAPALRPLLQLTGAGERLTFDGIATDFVLGQGFVETELLRLGRELGEIGVRGRTGLDGALDYRLDLRAALAQHSDGRKVLEALGGNLPEAVLGGTLDQPRLELPEPAKLLEQTLRQGVQKGIEDLLRRIGK